jgi:hypothetical protein
MSQSKSLTVSIRSDINTMSDHIAANVSSELSHQINRKLLGEVCEQLFGTTDVEYVRDVFNAIQQDLAIQDRVLTAQTKRRIGVK